MNALTILGFPDLDLIDPQDFVAVSTPEPGGISYQVLKQTLAEHIVHTPSLSELRWLSLTVNSTKTLSMQIKCVVNQQHAGLEYQALMEFKLQIHC